MQKKKKVVGVHLEAPFEPPRQGKRGEFSNTSLGKLRELEKKSTGGPCGRRRDLYLTLKTSQAGKNSTNLQRQHSDNLGEGQENPS